MKKLFIIFFSVCCASTSYGQNYLDSIRIHKMQLLQTPTDTARLSLYLRLSDDYLRNNYDSGLFYAKQGLNLAKKMEYKLGEAYALCAYEFGLRETGRLAEALNIQLQTLAIARTLNDGPLEAGQLNSIGNSYLELGDALNAIDYYKASASAFGNLDARFWNVDEKGNARPVNYIISTSLHYWRVNELSNIGNAFEKLNQLDSAFKYLINLFADTTFPYDLMPELLCRLGNVHIKMGKINEAKAFFWKGIELSMHIQSISDRTMIYMQLARIYNGNNQPDSAFHYAREAYATAKTISFRKVVLDASKFLGEIYSKASRFDSAYFYQAIAMQYNDSLFGKDKFRDIQVVFSDEQKRQQVLAAEQEQLRAKYQWIGVISIFLFLAVIIAVIARANRRQKKANRLLSTQKLQITEQRDKIENAMTELNRTQAQLVQSEKMASLGEVTAGIAHEIQNPLNFINNFSEVNAELSADLQKQMRSGVVSEAILTANTIALNMQKIVEHGKRADTIVKGMLQHSQSGRGEKTSIDIKNLTEEYIRLSYRSMRNKDSSFNAVIETHYDPAVERAFLAPQEIGKVLLNLFNNAFYSVHEKKKKLGKSFEPVVTVRTAKTATGITISVSDNGTGIPQHVVEKIYQPFFTTKPTGEGTGLGLSLSYDIITKGHGGKLLVETAENNGANFIIELPA